MAADTAARLPILAITLGDVAGIGPEIVAKALVGHPALRRVCVPVVVGDVGALRRGARACGFDPGSVREIGDPDLADNEPGTVDVLQDGPDLRDVPVGRLSAKAGDAAYRFVVRACALAREKRISGIVTAPLNKEAMHLGGHDFAGHTELLAHEFGVRRYSMILSAGGLYVFHLTTHVSLRNAIDLCTRARALDVLRLAAALARSMGKPDARIGVAGLNPHAGEHGLFGNEEITQLGPAVQDAQREGINAHGPISADALFPQAFRGEWDMVIACYHDQGHVAFKSVYGSKGVNITAGLPVVRVSVDHGTAFDIAGKGIAREDSLVLACERAAELSDGWAHVWKAAASRS